MERPLYTNVGKDAYGREVAVMVNYDEANGNALEILIDGVYYEIVSLGHPKKSA